MLGLGQKPAFCNAHRWQRSHNITLHCVPQAKASASGVKSIPEIKSALNEVLQGTDRGIFGVPTQKKVCIHELLQDLEHALQCPCPMDRTDLLAGDWRLLYSTITIMGSKRTKLGLRDFIQIDDLLQSIDFSSNVARNEVLFSAKGLNLLQGALTLESEFTRVSCSRVDIRLKSSSLAPPQLQDLFQKNLDLLLSIFNPEGYLEVTYLDEQHRVGHDSKGNIFYLEKVSRQ